MEVKRIRLNKLDNTRYLGGFPAADGAVIRPRRLIRSGELSKADENDLAVLKNEYRVRTIVDLRMEAEREQSPDPPVGDAEKVFLPILDSSFFGIARDENSIKAWMRLFDDPSVSPESVFKEMYRKLMFSEYVRPYYRRFFDILLEDKPGAVLWHCSAGKDRAGITAMLVLMALGVSRELMIRDYMMTGVFSKKELRKRKLMIRFLVRDKRKKHCFRVLLDVREEYVRQLFSIIDRDYGSETGYLTSFIGLTEEEILRLRELYLEKE